MGKFYEINYIHTLNLDEPNMKSLDDFGIFGAGTASLQGPVTFTIPAQANKDFTAVWLVLKGRVSVECAGKRIDASPGALILRLPGEEQQVTFLDDSFDHVYFLIRHRHTDTMQFRQAVHLHEIHTLMNLLYYECIEKKDGYESNISHLPLLILNLLKRNLDDSSHNRIEAIFRILEQHPKQIWTTSKLAAKLHISPSLLYKLCRRYYDKSPSEIIQSVKMRHVNSLLLSTDENLDIIAEQLGYSSAFALSKIYRKYYGRRPGSVRRNHFPEG